MSLFDEESFEDLLGETHNDEESADDLLASTDENAKTSDAEPVPEAEAAKDDQRIRDLEEQLRVLTEAQARSGIKTPEEKDKDHRVALRETAAVLSAKEQLEPVSEDDDVITIHVLDTGLTFADRVWSYGQTIQFKRGGLAYSDTVDRTGKSWLDDISPEAQLQRFHKIIVGSGPYTGPEFKDELTESDKQRGNAAPIITVH